MRKTLFLMFLLPLFGNIPIMAQEEPDSSKYHFATEKARCCQEDERPCLVQTALFERKKLRLTEIQIDSLNYIYGQIQHLKQTQDSLHSEEFSDSIRNLDHSGALSMLSKNQFKRVVATNYESLNDDVDKIWDAISKADMISDLEEKKERLYIKYYLIELRVAAETYWNDADQRRKAEHQIKVYAPQVVKRYFATKPKRKNNPNAEFTNYVW